MAGKPKRAQYRWMTLAEARAEVDKAKRSFAAAESDLARHALQAQLDAANWTQRKAGEAQTGAKQWVGQTVERMKEGARQISAMNRGAMTADTLYAGSGFTPIAVRSTRGPWEKDVGDDDFVQLSASANFYKPKAGERYVTGIGSAAGRSIPVGLALKLGGYVDPQTRKTVRSGQDARAANQFMTGVVFRELGRRGAVMKEAAQERGSHSSNERRAMTVVRGGVDGAAFGGFPYIAAGAKSALEGTPFAQNLALEKYQVARDEAEYPVLRAGSEFVGGVAAPNPLSKGKALALFGKLGADVAWDTLGGVAQGYATSEGSAEDRLREAAISGLSSVAIGRAADGVVTFGGRALDRLAPAGWRKATGYDMPASELFRDAASKDGVNMNGLLLPNDGVPYNPAGPHLKGLAEAVSDTQAARTGGLQYIPSRTAEGQSYRARAASLDPYSFAQLSDALAYNPQTLDRLVLGDFLEGQRRKTSAAAKKMVAKATEMAVDRARD